MERDKGMKSGEGRESSRHRESSIFGQHFSLPVHWMTKNSQQQLLEDGKNCKKIQKFSKLQIKPKNVKFN